MDPQKVAGVGRVFDTKISDRLRQVRDIELVACQSVTVPRNPRHVVYERSI